LDVPEAIIANHKYIILDIDMFWVNGLCFLKTSSTQIKYQTAQFLLNTKAETLMACLLTACAAYRQRGFVIRQVNADGQFAPLLDKALEAHIPLNTTAEDEHAKVVKTSIPTVKERVRSKINTLPFKRIQPASSLALYSPILSSSMSLSL